MPSPPLLPSSIPFCHEHPLLTGFRGSGMVSLRGDDTPLGFNGGPEETNLDHPPHRRTFSFSVSPSRKASVAQSNWGTKQSISSISLANRSGTVPSVSKLPTPREGSSEGWRQTIGASRLAIKRPSSAPGKKRKKSLRVAKQQSEREVTHQLIQSSIARSESSLSLQQQQQQQEQQQQQQREQRNNQTGGIDMGLAVPRKRKKRAPKKLRRPKSAAISRSNSMAGQKRMMKTPSLGIGTQFYTSK